MAIITETAGQPTLERWVYAQYAYLLALIEYTNAHAREMRAVVRKADEETVVVAVMRLLLPEGFPAPRRTDRGTTIRVEGEAFAIEGMRKARRAGYDMTTLEDAFAPQQREFPAG